MADDHALYLDLFVAVDRDDSPPFFQETDNSVRLKIASLLGLLSKTNGFSPDCVVDDVINVLGNESTAHSTINAETVL